MSKYWQWIRFFFLRSMQYRAEALVWIGLSTLPNIILLFIWQSAYGTIKVVHGYDLSQILQYFLFGSLINGITATHFEEYRSREIREGKIDNYLTKPITYPIQILLADIGDRLFFLLLSVPIFWLTFLWLMQVFHFSIPIFNPLQIAEFLLLLFFGYAIEFSCAFATVLLTFWFEGAAGIEHFKWITVTVFSGVMIPFSFMPQWLQNLVVWLPFKYMYGIPIDILQARTTLHVQDLGQMSISLLLIVILLFYLWRKAMYKYSSGGG